MHTSKGWRETKLGAVARIDRVVVHPAAISQESVYVGLEHVDPDGTIAYQTVAAGELRSAKFAFSERHVLYGKLRPYLRKVGRPNTAGICSTDILPVLVGPGLDRDYLFHWLRQPRIVSLASARSDGVNLPRVSPKTLLDLPFSLPPLEEQRRIATMLDKTEAVRRMRSEAFLLPNQVLSSAFFEMFGDPVSNEREWPRAQLGELLPERHLIVDGPFGSSLKPDSYVDSGVRVIRNFNIKDDAFDGSAFKFITAEKFDEVRRSEVKPGDVLISTKGTLGNVCLMPDLPGPSVLSATGTIRIRLSGEDRIRRRFLVSQMVSPPYKEYVKSFQAGTNQKYLTIAAIRKLTVILPPTDLQDRFCQLRERVKDLKARLADAAGDARALSDSMARNLFLSDGSEEAGRASSRAVPS